MPPLPKQLPTPVRLPQQLPAPPQAIPFYPHTPPHPTPPAQAPAAPSGCTGQSPPAPAAAPGSQGTCAMTTATHDSQPPHAPCPRAPHATCPMPTRVTNQHVGRLLGGAAAQSLPLSAPSLPLPCCARAEQHAASHAAADNGGAKVCVRACVCVQGTCLNSGASSGAPPVRSRVVSEGLPAARAMQRSATARLMNSVLLQIG